MGSILANLFLKYRVEKLELELTKFKCLEKSIEKLELELTKFKRLEKAIEELYGVLSDHQKSFEEIRHTLSEFARGLQVLGEAIAGINNNNNHIIPYIGQLQLDHSKFVASFQQLVDVLVEAEVIHRIMPEFDSVH